MMCHVRSEIELDNSSRNILSLSRRREKLPSGTRRRMGEEKKTREITTGKIYCNQFEKYVAAL